jgi:hypothetical protein
MKMEKIFYPTEKDYNDLEDYIVMESQILEKKHYYEEPLWNPSGTAKNYYDYVVGSGVHGQTIIVKNPSSCSEFYSCKDVPCRCRES